jgi:hypothetical protein
MRRAARPATCSNREDDMAQDNTTTLTYNLRLARRAIDYLKGLNISSNNQPIHHVAGWINRTFGTHFYEFNTFLLSALRWDWRVTGGTEKKADRATILKILRSRLAPGQKRELLQALMQKWGVNHFHEPRLYCLPPGPPDRERIRYARKAIKFRVGNCGEKSAICATYCLENSAGPLNIFWMCANKYDAGGNQIGWDHAYVIIGCSRGDFGQSPSNFPDEAVVVDGWSEDYYQLKNFLDIRHGTLFPNPFQWSVRKMLCDFAVGASVMEEAHLHDPPIYAPGFTLAQAERPNKDYRVPVALDDDSAGATRDGSSSSLPSSVASALAKLPGSGSRAPMIDLTGVVDDGFPIDDLRDELAQRPTLAGPARLVL